MRKFIAIFLLSCLSMGTAIAKANELLAVKAKGLPDSRVRIDFCFSQPLSQLPASFITQKPPRLVLDFIDTQIQMDENVRSQLIKLGSINHYNIVSVGNRVRAILDLSGSVAYSGEMMGRVYSLTVSGKTNQLFPRSKEVFVTNQHVNARHDILRIDFRGVEKGGGRMIVDVSDASIPIDVVQRGKEMVVNFNNTRLVSGLPTRYDVSDFHSPAKIITARQEGKLAKLIIKSSSGNYGHFAYQVNKQFIVDLFPLTPDEIKQAKLKKKVFSGKRISLNFQNIPIRSVLQLLADFTGVNMVVSDAVRGDITLRLNDIPWDQALDIILTTQGLDKRVTGNVMLVDLKSNLDRQEEDRLKSQIKLETLAPLSQELLQVNYAKAADLAILIKDKENSLLTPRGKISVDVRTNTIWIRETSAQIERVRELIRKLDIPVKQVLVEARIVTVKKDFAQDLGIRFGVSRPTHLSGTLDGANQLANGTPPAQVTPLARRLNVDLGITPVLGNPASIGIALAKLGDGVLLDLEILALESEGKAEFVSSPRLITSSQQAALIESGQEIPYQQATSSGATAVSFKKAVLSLKVTPQITPDNKIFVDLQINQDSDSGQRVLGVPIILTKSIQTNVLVNNGQTIVLGGIYEQNKNQTIERVPFLGALPVVGNMFRNKNITVHNQELLIFITPKIMTDALSITTIEGQEHPREGAVELDKFGKPVRFEH